MNSIIILSPQAGAGHPGVLMLVYYEYVCIKNKGTWKSYFNRADRGNMISDSYGRAV